MQRRLGEHAGTRVAGLCAVVLLLTLGATNSYADSFTFYSTTTPSAWTVSEKSGPWAPAATDFNTAGPFNTAVAVTGRAEFIADVASGSHGGVGNWTLFIFRQTFDLTGFNQATANLQFQWAADDIGGAPPGSGNCAADRGCWLPVFSLNGGALTNGGVVVDYGYDGTVTLASGFVTGLNTIDFYVEGNGQTDGFALKLIDATARPSDPPSEVPEPSSLLLLGSGIVGLGSFWRRRLF